MPGRDHTRGEPPAGALLAPTAWRWWGPIAVLAVLAALYLAGEALGVRQHLAELDGWIEGFGVLAPAVFVGVYVFVALVGLPIAPLTAAAGAMFTVGVGIGAAMAASVIAAAVSFLAARHLAPVWLRQRLAGRAGFRRLDRLVVRRGATVVLAARLVNLLPFALVNYGFGLTRVRFGTYLLCSALGKLPGTVVLVVGVGAVREAIQYQRIPWSQWALVLVLSVAMSLTIRWTRRWLRQAEQPDEPEPTTAQDSAGR